MKKLVVIFGIVLIIFASGCIAFHPTSVCYPSKKGNKMILSNKGPIHPFQKPWIRESLLK